MRSTLVTGQPVGFVGDWCPVCQDIRVSRTFWLGSRLKFIDPRYWSPPIYVARCTTCRTPQLAAARYLLAEPRPAPAVELALRTTPGILARAEDLSRRLIALAGRPEHDDARIQHLLDAIDAVELLSERHQPPHIEDHPGGDLIIRGDVVAWLAVIAAFSAAAWFTWKSTPASPLAVGLLVLAVLLAACFTWRLAWGERHWTSRHLVPRIALAARPIDASALEVELAVRQARVNGAPGARHLDHRILHRRIAALPHSAHASAAG